MVSSSPISPELMRTAPKVRDLTPQTQAFNQEVNRQVSKTNDGMKVNAKVEPLTGVTSSIVGEDRKALQETNASTKPGARPNSDRRHQRLCDGDEVFRSEERPEHDFRRWPRPHAGPGTRRWNYRSVGLTCDSGRETVPASRLLPPNLQFSLISILFGPIGCEIC
jgi:hypothetical protein